MQRARDAGLRADASVAGRPMDVGASILAEAAAVDADVIFVGTRGRGDVTSFLLGSVSQHLVHHADRAVTVVPSPELVGRRRHIPDAVPASQPLPVRRVAGETAVWRSSAR